MSGSNRSWSGSTNPTDTIGVDVQVGVTTGSSAASSSAASTEQDKRARTRKERITDVIKIMELHADEKKCVDKRMNEVGDKIHVAEKEIDAVFRRLEDYLAEAEKKLFGKSKSVKGKEETRTNLNSPVSSGTNISSQSVLESRLRALELRMKNLEKGSTGVGSRSVSQEKRMVQDGPGQLYGIAEYGNIYVDVSQKLCKAVGALNTLHNVPEINRKRNQIDRAQIEVLKRQLNLFVSKLRTSIQNYKSVCPQLDECDMCGSTVSCESNP